LTAKVAYYLVDKFWPAKGCTIDAYLVGTSRKHSFNIPKFAYTPAYCERNVNFGSHFLHHIREGFAAFVTGGNVEEDQFVCPLLTVYLAEFDGISSLTELQEIGALDGLAVFDIEAGYDSLC
jgi:hypothetical protein